MSTSTYNGEKMIKEYGDTMLGELLARREALNVKVAVVRRQLPKILAEEAEWTAMASLGYDWEPRRTVGDAETLLNEYLEELAAVEEMLAGMQTPAN